MIPITLFGCMCAAAIVVSYMGALPAKERGCLVFAAWVLAVNWLLFSMPWIHAPLAPAFLAYEYGFTFSNKDMWAVADVVALVAVMTKCRHAWWSPLLWVPYLITLTMHAIAWCNGLEYIEYSSVLDASLVMQLAVIFMLGGGGCADRLLGVWGRIRHMVRSAIRSMGVVA